MVTTLSAATPRTLAIVLDNRWMRFATRRAGQLVVSVWVLITASFLIIHLIPGDPVRAALGPTAPAAMVNAQRAALGLNAPLWLQYARYLRGVFTGDLGTSITLQLPVSQVIGDRLPATVELAVLAFSAAIAIAIPSGC